MSRTSPGSRLARLAALSLALATAIPAMGPPPAAAIPLPIANPDTFTMAENDSITISHAQLLANDLYGASIQIRGTSGPGGWGMGQTSFTYDPQTGFNGVATVEYAAVNQAGTSAPVLVTINITGANASPVVSTNGAKLSVRKGDWVDVEPVTELSINDAEAWTNDLELTVDPAFGTVSFPSDPPGLTYLTGDGSHDGRIVVRGTLSDLSDATDELRYHAPAGFVDDADFINVTLDDLGCCGTGTSSPTTRTIWADLLRDETTAPTVTAPKTAIRSGVGVKGSELPVAVSWTQDDASGIAWSRPERETDGDADWIGFTAPGTAAPTSVKSGVWIGHTFRWRVRAADRWGNLSAWAYGPTLRARLVQQNASAIAYRGAWKKATSSVYSGGSAMFAKAAGASATFTFTGRSVAWMSRKASNRGKAKIYVDGTYVKTVDLYRASAAGRHLVFARTWASSGRHTIRIVVKGTAGRPRVDLDGFAILK